MSDRPCLHRRSRRWLPLLVAVAVAVTVAGRAEASTPPGDSGTAATRTVETAFGVVEVPADPRRVVSLDQYTTLALLDIGFPLAGTIEGLENVVPADVADVYAALPKVGTWELNMEALAALEPDLVLGNAYLSTDEYGLADYRAIAPTVLVGDPDEDGGIPWQEWARQTADAVNRIEDLEVVVDRYRDRIDGLGEEFGTALGDVSWAMVYTFTEGVFSIQEPDFWGGVVLNDLGVTWADAATTGTSGDEISAEHLDVLDDAGVLLYQVEVDGTVLSPVRSLLDNPLWSALPAVEAGHSYAIRNFYALGYGAAMDLLVELEAVLEDLAA